MIDFEDIYQVWLAIYSISTARYLIAAGAVAWVLYRLARHWSAQRRIQARRASGRDVRREVLFSLQTTAIYAVVGVAVVAGERAGYLKIYSDFDLYGWVYGLASLPLLLILHDAYFYWVHRLMHHRRLFRHFHRVHHLSRTPTPWAAYAFGPGEALLMVLFVPLAAAFMPIHDLVLSAFLVIMIIRNAMGHSGIEFHPPWWVDTPLDRLTTVTHHDLHHQHFNCNFGLYFTWWDRWLGTEHRDYRARFKQAAQPSPRPVEPARTAKAPVTPPPISAPASAGMPATAIEP